MIRMNKTAGLVIGLLAAAAAVTLILKIFFGGGGAAVVPSRSIKVKNVRCYGQTNEAWAADTLGSSSYTMGAGGCLTTCIAASLSMQHENTGAGEAFTPGELNALFTENGVYNESGDIVWGRVENALPEAAVEVAGSVDAGEVEALLEASRYPAVKVKNHGNGAWHWVLIAGADDNGYQCMDPLSDRGEIVPLDAHGGKIYAVRAVYWTDAGGDEK